MRRLLLVIALCSTLAYPQQILGPIMQQKPASGIVVTAKTCAGGNTSSSVTSVSCTWSASPVAGESIACSVGAYVSGETFTVTDSASNTYTANGSQFLEPANPIYTQQFYFVNLGGSITTTTFHLTTSTTFPFILCNSATGVASGPDGQCNKVVAGGSGLASCTAAITTTANDWIYCSMTGGGASTFTVGSGFTLGSQIAANVTSQYLVQLSSGAITPSATENTAAQNWILVCSAYK